MAFGDKFLVGGASLVFIHAIILMALFMWIMPDGPFPIRAFKVLAPLGVIGITMVFIGFLLQVLA